MRNGPLFSFSLFCLMASVGQSQSAPVTTPPIAVAAPPQAVATPTDPAELLKVAAALNGLDGEGITPWHLKATFQLYDQIGGRLEQGTYEEFWVAPHEYKRTYTTPSSTQTEWATRDGKYYRSGHTAVPYFLLSLIRSLMVSPLPSAKEIEEAALVKHEQAVGKAKLICVSLTDPAKIPVTIATEMFESPGIFQTYCFQQDRPILRISTDYGDVQAVGDEIVMFQKRYLPKNVIVTSHKKSLLEVQLQSLAGLGSLRPPEFVPPANVAEVPSDLGTSLSPRGAQGHILRKVQFVYPQETSWSQAMGKVSWELIVILEAVIGKNGDVMSVMPISSRDPDLTKAAINAVKQWKYLPFLINGEPAEFHSLINVVLKIGSNPRRATD